MAAIVAVVYMVGLFRDDYFASISRVVASCGCALGLYFAYTLCNPMADSAGRFQACAFAAAIIFAGLALAEQFMWDLPWKPFRYLAGVAVGTVLLGSYGLPVWSFVLRHAF